MMGRHRSRARVLKAQDVSIRGEAKYIIERARARDGRLVALGALIFFSTDTGDAWMLDREDRLAVCLARDGEEQEYSIAESDAGFAVEWKGRFDLSGNAFIFSDNVGRVRTVIGYPVAEIRRAL